mgnify:CR=1 FL=1
MHKIQYKKNKNTFLIAAPSLPHKLILFLKNNILINNSETGIVYEYSELMPPILLKIRLPLLWNDKKTGRKITNENIETLLFISIFWKPWQEAFPIPYI